MSIKKLRLQLPGVSVATNKAELTLELQHRLGCCGLYVDGGEIVHPRITKRMHCTRNVGIALNMNARSLIEYEMKISIDQKL